MQNVQENIHCKSFQLVSWGNKVTGMRSIG